MNHLFNESMFVLVCKLSQLQQLPHINNLNILSRYPLFPILKVSYSGIGKENGILSVHPLGGPWKLALRSLDHLLGRNYNVPDTRPKQKLP